MRSLPPLSSLGLAFVLLSAPLTGMLAGPESPPEAAEEIGNEALPEASAGNAKGASAPTVDSLKTHKPGQAHSISKAPVRVSPLVAWSVFGLAFVIMLSAVILFARLQLRG